MKKDELMESEEKKFIFTLPYKLLAFGLIVFFGFYLWDVFFGTRSITEYMKLLKQEQKLKKEIKKSKKENEKLQKKLFEYEVLVPTNSE